MFVIRCNHGWCPNLTDFYHLIFYQCHCKIHISVTVECDPSTKTLMRLRVCHCCVVYWSLALLNEGRTMMWCIVSAWNRYRCLDCEYVHGRWVLQPTDHTIQTSFKMVECLCCRSIILLFKAVIASYCRPIVDCGVIFSSSCASSSFNGWWIYFKELSI